MTFLLPLWLWLWLYVSPSWWKVSGEVEFLPEMDPYSSSSSSSSCGGVPFMSYKQCGTDCPQRCGEPPVQFCNYMCVEGCFCDDGYCWNETRIQDENENENENDDAILKRGTCEVYVEPPPSPETCAQKLLVYDECGTACPLQCGEKPAEVCTEQCVEGCFCEDGYCMNQYGNCELYEKDETPPPPEMAVETIMEMIAADEAPPLSIEEEGQKEKCDKDLFLEYQECGTACPLQCGEEPAEICTMQCVEGCFCMDGYCQEKDGSCSVLVETKAKAMTMEEETDPSSGAIATYSHMGVAGIVASMLVM